MICFLFLVSFFVVAFSQPAWIPGFGIVAASCGFALFWKAMLLLSRPRDRFFSAILWFAFVQAIQLSWMTSIQYMGPLIFVVYVFLILSMGLQFGLVSLLIAPGGILDWRRCLSIAGCWVLFEWIRLFFLTGFTWNPVGLALAHSSYSLQFAALWGVYGLSFWVVLVNLAALRVLVQKKGLVVWLTLAIFPYGFGVFHKFLIEARVPVCENITVALVQTALLPEQKWPMKDQKEAFVPPLNQWERILTYLNDRESVQLIVLPEGAVSLSAYRAFYPLELVKNIWIDRFGEKALADLPRLARPYAILSENPDRQWIVSNAFLAQALSNHYRADVIVGLDDHDIQDGSNYNAAFYFHPGGIQPERYEKRVLVPVAEYIPLIKWRQIARFISNQFGIGDSFAPGVEAKIFPSTIPIGVSICCEETYSELIREVRLKGAKLFVNLTNDAWFPKSRLAQQHFDHGRVRAAENGVYVVRSCNTGITGGIDCFGKPLECLPASEEIGSALYLSLPIRSFQTLYTWWGDKAILSFSLLFLLIDFGFRKKKLP